MKKKLPLLKILLEEARFILLQKQEEKGCDGKRNLGFLGQPTTTSISGRSKQKEECSDLWRLIVTETVGEPGIPPLIVPTISVGAKQH